MVTCGYLICDSYKLQICFYHFIITDPSDKSKAKYVCYCLPNESIKDLFYN